MVNLYSEKKVTSPGTYFHQLPYPCYMNDEFLFMIQHVMPLCLTISWVYSVAMLVQHIVYEKEQRLKEVSKVEMQIKLNYAVQIFSYACKLMQDYTINVISYFIYQGNENDGTQKWSSLDCLVHLIFRSNDCQCSNYDNDVEVWKDSYV